MKRVVYLILMLIFLLAAVWSASIEDISQVNSFVSFFETYWLTLVLTVGVILIMPFYVREQKKFVPNGSRRILNMSPKISLLFGLFNINLGILWLVAMLFGDSQYEKSFFDQYGILITSIILGGMGLYNYWILRKEKKTSEI